MGKPATSRKARGAMRKAFPTRITNGSGHGGWAREFVSHWTGADMHGSVVIRGDGTQGTVVSGADRKRLVIEFRDGSREVASAEQLVRQQDGTYRLARGAGGAVEENREAVEKNKEAENREVVEPNREGAESQGMVIPVIGEELSIEKRQVARGKVRVSKRVETREETVEAPSTKEEVVVEHVPIGRFVEDGVPQTHEDNGVLVIPIVEEVSVVEKRLFLREEVRVSKRRTTTTTPQTVTLRREVADVERVDFSGTQVPESD